MAVTRHRLASFVESAEHFLNCWYATSDGQRGLEKALRERTITLPEAWETLRSMIHDSAPRPHHVQFIGRERAALDLNWRRNERTQLVQQAKRRAYGIPERKDGEVQRGNPKGIRRETLRDVLINEAELQDAADRAVAKIQAQEEAEAQEAQKAPPGAPKDERPVEVTFLEGDLPAGSLPFLPDKETAQKYAATFVPPAAKPGDEDVDLG